jgi:hypothetical protein
LKQYDRKQIASALVEVFDRIYSYPLFSLRSVVRSFLFSFIVTLIYVYEFQPSAFEAVRQIPSSKFDDLDKIDAYGALYMLFFNAATDYVALFVIRATLVRLGRRPLFALASCIGAAILLISIGMVIRFEIIGYIIFGGWAKFKGVLSETADAWLKSDVYSGIPAIAVFVWLPLFAAGILFARATTPLTWLTGKAQWLLKDGREHPLKAVGYVASAMVFTFGAVLQRFI